MLCNLILHTIGQGRAISDQVYALPVKSTILVRLIVAGALLATTSACGDKMSAADFQACMEAAQETIREKIDAGINGEQVYQEAMNECGFEQLNEPERNKLFSGS